MIEEQGERIRRMLLAEEVMKRARESGRKDSFHWNSPTGPRGEEVTFNDGTKVFYSESGFAPQVQSKKYNGPLPTFSDWDWERLIVQTELFLRKKEKSEKSQDSY